MWNILMKTEREDYMWIMHKSFFLIKLVFCLENRSQKYFVSLKAYELEGEACLIR